MKELDGNFDIYASKPLPLVRGRLFSVELPQPGCDPRTLHRIISQVSNIRIKHYQGCKVRIDDGLCKKYLAENSRICSQIPGVSKWTKGENKLGFALCNKHRNSTPIQN